MKRNSIKTSWLHISDLHVFAEADTILMLDDYAELTKVISPQFLVVTGDFRHKKYNTSFSGALEYLESLINIFHIDKKDVFLVPGNHDVNFYDGRINDIVDICQCSEKDDYNIYSKYQLRKGFSEYCDFVNQFYFGSDVTDARTSDPSGVNSVVWNNLINIIFLNTALISDGEEHKQIVDINALSKCKIDFSKPSILLGHHGIESLYPCHAERVIGIIDRWKISAYLHGDSHRYANQPISKISTPNNTIPGITCAKSAPQSGDSFSDIGVVYYEWQNDDNIYVQAYRWTQKGFIEDPAYYYGVDKKYFFPLMYDKGDDIAYDVLVHTDIKQTPPTIMIQNGKKNQQIGYATNFTITYN